MTASAGSTPSDPLDPLTTALLDRARRDAEALLADADADVEVTLADARAEASAALGEARAKGAADAAAVLAGERSRAEREARAVLMAAHQEARERLRRAGRDAVCGLREDAAYPALLAGLRRRAARDLGPLAAVAEQPRGGLVAVAGGRRVDYSLEGLADDVMDRLEADDGSWPR
jgi:vacuolar-type H+-ATPase subunit E/Vma4